MTTDSSITLRLTVEHIEALCRHVAEHAPRAEQAVTALVTLQSLITTTADPATQASDDYQLIKARLDAHTEQARQRLIAENAARLTSALRNQDLTAIAAIYAPLSRSGFWEVATQATTALNGAEQAVLAGWCREWLTEAKRRGEAASGYPDAIDFMKADIDVTEYSAMGDLARLLGATPH